uniref:non-specific serine/threonine protein kinase n=1 Tax=Ananas comosus var. bracteatus TaxID=296719 RepID=A0A6V7NLI2_ANACO|nr:unnamed protein product [Ananas comosus var. bracteatus]
MRGTIGYLAPEWISGLPISPKVDVYSFGMMLFEIISSQKNSMYFEEGSKYHYPSWAAQKVIEGDEKCLFDSKLGGEADLEEVKRASRVACWCIQDEEIDRPTMGQVVQILEGVLEVNVPRIPRSLQHLMEDHISHMYDDVSSVAKQGAISDLVVEFDPSNSNASTAVLLDSSNLILTDSVNSLIIWQSFDYPGDTWMPGGWLGFNKITGEYQSITCWENPENPAPGPFSQSLDPDGSDQSVILYNRSQVYLSSGLWNGQYFSLVPVTGRQSVFNLTFINNRERKYAIYTIEDSSVITRYVLGSSGLGQQLLWLSNRQEWQPVFTQPLSHCDVPSVCGPFGLCDLESPSLCRCPQGFEPALKEEWELNDWNSGCKRKSQLKCGTTSNLNRGGEEKDGFFMMINMRLPSNGEKLMVRNAEECEMACLNNCSCSAYSFNTSCLIWTAKLQNLQQLYSSDHGGGTVYLRLAAADLPSTNNSHKVKTTVTITKFPSFACFINSQMDSKNNPCFSLPPFYPSFLFFFFFFSLKTHLSLPTDSLSLGQSLSGNQTLISKEGNFELGFFSPSTSDNNFYIGIWYKKLPTQTIVWVANRDAPIFDTSSAELKISDQGNLVLLNGSKSPIWSSSSTPSNSNATTAVLLDSSNLILTNSVNSSIVWQSFDHPTDTFMPGGWITGEYQSITCWENPENPAPVLFLTAWTQMDQTNLFYYTMGLKYTGVVGYGMASTSLQFR